MKAHVNGIDIEYETVGDPGGRPLLLIMGLGAQLRHWSPALLDQLAAKGFHLILMDNRDIGLSTKFDAAGAPDLEAIATGRATAPYTLMDMTRDAVGLLDALGVARADIVGASMGGAIVQLLAAHFPERVRSMTAIMSTSGRADLPQPDPDVMAAITVPPLDDSIEAAIDNNVRLMRVLGSPGYDYDTPAERARFREIVERSSYPEGSVRQLAAVIATGDMRESLKRVRVPTVVIHGDSDPLVPTEAGRDVAANILGADLVIIKGLAHDMPPFAIDRIADEIVRVAGKA